MLVPRVIKIFKLPVCKMLRTQYCFNNEVHNSSLSMHLTAKFKQILFALAKQIAMRHSIEVLISVKIHCVTTFS
jgi:hypothetical protein